MTRDQLLPLLRRMVDYAQTGATAIHPDGARNHPIATYTDREQFELEKRRIIHSVVDREDCWVSAHVQKNFNAGRREHTTFGANEPSLINMHRTFRRMAGLPLVDEPAEISG